MGSGISAAQVIDLGGLALAPGFVDIHSHGDGTLDEDGRAESLIRQGITTIVAGQDGGSRSDLSAPWPPAVGQRRDDDRARHRARRGRRAGRPACDARRAARMVAMVEQAVANGACGASSGLEYPPSGFARPDELVALCRPLASRGLPYATHMRNEDDRLLESIDESISVSRGARAVRSRSRISRPRGRATGAGWATRWRGSTPRRPRDSTSRSTSIRMWPTPPGSRIFSRSGAVMEEPRSSSRDWAPHHCSRDFAPRPRRKWR